MLLPKCLYHGFHIFFPLTLSLFFVDIFEHKNEVGFPEIKKKTKKYCLAIPLLWKYFWNNLNNIRRNQTLYFDTHAMELTSTPIYYYAVMTTTIHFYGAAYWYIIISNNGDDDDDVEFPTRKYFNFFHSFIFTFCPRHRFFYWWLFMDPLAK